MLWTVIALLEVVEPPRESAGSEWRGKMQLPTFYVDALSASSAKVKVVETLCVGRLIKAPIHVTMTIDGDPEPYEITIIPRGHEIPEGTKMIHWLAQDATGIPIP